MTRVSSPIFFAIAAIAFASPAFAKTSIQKGANLCEAEIPKQYPALKTIRVDKDGVKATGGAFVYTVRARNADGSAGKLICTVDRETEAVSVTKAP
jgi:hypothetical protein